MFRETRLRSGVKTISWRTVATLTTAILVFIFTKKIAIAVTIGSLEVVAKIFLYFFHERAWDKISFGRKEAVPCVLWFTGLPASGKRTLAESVYNFLKDKSFNVERLDGEKVREIFPATGFSKEERNRHIKKIGLLASILERNKIIVVASFISPYKESRDFVRNFCKNFIEIYVNTPLSVCEQRDSKGMYRLARQGKISNFTGINDPYEAPRDPQITINSQEVSSEEGLRQILDYLKKNKFLT